MTISAIRRPIFMSGLVITMLLLAMAVLSLFWTPYSPTKMQIANKLKAPLEQGLLGTDHFGRDVLSMLMVGAWNSLSISLIAVALGASVGSLIGVVVAAKRGVTENIVMRLCDIIFALPPILSAMMLGAFIGAGRFTAIVAIAVFMVPVFARLTLGSALQIWTRDYVTAAIAMGRSRLPNIAHIITVQITIQLGLAILTETGLSFLGLGMPPPTPTWGRMLSDAQTYLGVAPWLAIMPGIAIALAVLGFNMLGDGLRDLLDPRSRST
jgi:peptide/nickel transport system permease protein